MIVARPASAGAGAIAPVRPDMSPTDPTIAITGRGALRYSARPQTVATAPVASAAARAFDKPGINRHGRLARTIPTGTLR